MEGLRTPCADKISKLWIARAKLCKFCADVSILSGYSWTDTMHTIFHFMRKASNERRLGEGGNRTGGRKKAALETGKVYGHPCVKNRA
jgi:hypothetical protein